MCVTYLYDQTLWPDPYELSNKATWKTPGFKEYHRQNAVVHPSLHRGRVLYKKEDEDQWEFVTL